MKLLQYGFKLYYSNSYNRHADNYEEEILDLNHYLDRQPGEHFCEKKGTLCWHGQDIGYILNTNGNLIVRLGNSTFYFSKKMVGTMLLRDILIEAVTKAKGLSKSNEILELLKR